jgi:hypothetical protein
MTIDSQGMLGADIEVRYRQPDAGGQIAAVRPLPFFNARGGDQRDALRIVGNDELICARCHQTLPKDKFEQVTSRHGKLFFRNTCRPCTTKRGKEYRRKTFERNRALIVAEKSVPCFDCGRLFPTVCMDFDHVSGEKKGGLSELKTRCSTEAVIAEMAKCQVVCANCHRIRTHLKRK